MSQPQNFNDRSRPYNPPPQLPKDYLRSGYLNEKGNIYRELLGEVAQNVAKALAAARPELTNGQFRRFFDHARMIEQRLSMLSSDQSDNDKWDTVAGELEKLKAFAAEAKAKSKVPPIFYEFITINVNATQKITDFRKGFMEHMQAVLAFHYYEKPKR